MKKPRTFMKHYWKEWRIITEITSSKNYDLAIKYAYHLHKAEIHDKSYIQNKNVAKYALSIGDLDQSERCYKAAIYDAVKLDKTEEENVTKLELTNGVLMLWGRYDDA